MIDTRAMAKWAGLTLLVGVAAALAACGGHDDHNNNGAATTPPVPPVVQSTDFEAYAKSTFANAPNTTPLDPSSVVFNFGVNDEPTAFDDLLM